MVIGVYPYFQFLKMSIRNRAAQVGVDVGFKMGDGVIAFFRHFHKSEPIALYSCVLAGVGNLEPKLISSKLRFDFKF